MVALQRAMPLTHTDDLSKELKLDTIFKIKSTTMMHKSLTCCDAAEPYESHKPCKFLFGRFIIFACGVRTSSLASWAMRLSVASEGSICSSSPWGSKTSTLISTSDQWIKIRE